MEQLKLTSVSVKGCSYIYAPDGQAGEYSPLAANPRRSWVRLLLCAKCDPNGRSEFDVRPVSRNNLLHHLDKDATKYQALGITEQVMLSSTTDPYHLGDTALTRDTLLMLKQYGMGICTLTKVAAELCVISVCFAPVGIFSFAP